MNNPASKQQGPDPSILEAIKRLTQTQLSPLEEQLFQGWLAANGMEDPEDPNHPIDLRGAYQESQGKVLPPGQLQKQLEQKADIDAIMQAQQAHEQASPINALMQGGGGQPDLQALLSGSGGPQGGGMPPQGPPMPSGQPQGGPPQGPGY